MSRRGVPMPYEHYHDGMTRPEFIRAQYRKWSRQGQTREWMLKNITNADGRVDPEEYDWMDQHVSQMFYQMVRKLLRLSPQFGHMLDFISRASERSQDEVLEHLRKQLWAKMQQIDDDRSHTELYIKLEQLYFITQDALPPDQPAAAPPRRRGSMFGTRPPRPRASGIEPALWTAHFEEEASAMIPEFWDAFDAQQ